jgi:cytochrome bd-I ubiquinol oxidase subunit X
MWYFSWILGLGLALCFGVLNAIWYDVLEQKRLELAAGQGRAGVAPILAPSSNGLRHQ